MSKGILLVVFAFVLVGVSYGSELSTVPVSRKGPGAGSDKELPLPTVTGRSVLSGPADAFNKAIKTHHHTKESPRPSSATGVSGSTATAVGPSSNQGNTLGGASSVQGGPVDAFNKATRSRHSRIEIATPSKAIGVVPTKPQQPTAAATTPPSTTTTPRQLLDTTSTHSGPTEIPNKAHHKVHLHRTSKKTAASSKTTTKPQERTAAAAVPHSTTPTPRQLLDTTSTPSGPTGVPNKAPSHKVHLHRTSKKAPAPSKTTTKPQEPTAAAGTPPSKSVTPRQLLDATSNHSGPTETPNKAHHKVHLHRTSKKTSAPIKTATKTPGHLPVNSKSTAQRTLLGGPADSFNKATHSHHGSKESTLPGKDTGVTPDQPQQQPTPTPAPAKQQPVSTASTQTVPTNTAMKKAIHAHHNTKKASGHGTATGASKRTLLAGPAEPTPTSPGKHQPVSTDNTQSGPVSAASKKAIHASHSTKKALAHDTTTGANKRTLLDSAADAFNKASRSHHATKEAALPGKDTGVNPDQPQQAPTYTSAPPKRNLLGADSTQSNPAEAFNKAIRSRHATKEASKPGKTTGARPGTTTTTTITTTTGSMPAQSAVNLQKPHSPGSHAVTEPGSRALLQWGWSGSSASASASAQAGSGGWGGNSWSGAQAQAQAQSQSFGGGYGGFGGYGWGRKLRAAAPSSVDI